MGMTLNDETVVFEKKVYENELVALKDYLSALNKKVTVDMTQCDDMHGGIIQLLLAYKSVHGSEFIFSDKDSTFKMALSGFRNVENNCN